MQRKQHFYYKDYNLYEKTASRYDKVRFSGRAGVWNHERQISILEQIEPDWQEKNVLEIGCGTGRITEFLVKNGAKVTATDISKEMLEIARVRVEKLNNIRRPELREMNLFDLTYDLSSYHYILAINVISRLSKPKTAIESIASAMSVNNILIFNFNCLTSILFPFGILVNVRRKSLMRDVTSRWFRPRRIHDYCTSAGLELLDWHGHHYVPSPSFLVFSLPFFKSLDGLISKRFPTCSPSVFSLWRLRSR